MGFNGVLLSGASGFLGKHIYNELLKFENVTTISRTQSDINVDLSTEIPDLPEAGLVVHCAGKAHSVPRTAAEKQAFFDVNVNGTLNLLKGLEKMDELPKFFVLISTVAVYGCVTGEMISEANPLNAQDAYGLSKVQAEELVIDWCTRNDVIFTILRLPLIAGPKPPGNLDTMIKGIKKGYYFNIGGGHIRKSIVMASDVAELIPKVARLGGIYNLTDGYHPSFYELGLLIAVQLGKKRPKNIPLWAAKLVAGFGDLLGEKMPLNADKLMKITAPLTFDDSKAREVLDWSPHPVIEKFRI